MLCGSLDGNGVWGRMEACICMAESLHCSPETVRTLLTTIQNEVFKNKLAVTLKKNCPLGLRALLREK